MIAEIYSQALDLVYPPRCICCSDILLFLKEKWLCDECGLKIFEQLKSETKRCEICDIPVDDNSKICSRCKTYDRFHERNYSVFEYNTYIRNIVHNYKYDGCPEYGKRIAMYMINYAIQNNIFNETNLVIPVPLHSQRLKERRFNQSEILADLIAGHFCIPCRNDIILRVKNTMEQNKLNFKERIENIKDAFEIGDKKSINGKNIIIIDDVYTTGSTVNELARVLTQNGSGKIKSFTFAIAATH